MAVSIRRRLLFKKQDGKCYYCQRQMNLGSQGPLHCTVDHKIPVSLGGTGRLKNLAGACFTCNNLKRDMTETQFREFMKTYVFKDALEKGDTRREIRKARDARIKEITAKGLVSRKNKMPKPPYIHRTYCDAVETVFARELAIVRLGLLQNDYDIEIVEAADVEPDKEPDEREDQSPRDVGNPG